MSFDPLRYCAICLSVFNDPRILTCGHSYCYACITEKQLCPKCPNIHIPSNLPINSYLSFNNHQETCKIAPKLAEIKCENCDDKLATNWCNSCAAFYCTDCSTTVHTIKTLRSHTSIIIADKLKLPNFTKCSTHFEERKCFCTECKILVCSGCIIDDHKTHQATTLFKYLDTSKNELKTTIAQKIENIIAQGGNIKKKIEAGSESLEREIQILEQRLTELRNHQKENNSELNTISNLTENIRNFEKYFTKTIEELATLDPDSIDFLKTSAERFLQSLPEFKYSGEALTETTLSLQLERPPTPVISLKKKKKKRKKGSSIKEAKAPLLENKPAESDPAEPEKKEQLTEKKVEAPIPSADLSALQLEEKVEILQESNSTPTESESTREAGALSVQETQDIPMQAEVSQSAEEGADLETLVEFENKKDTTWTDYDWLDTFVQRAPKKFKIILENEEGKVAYQSSGSINFPISAANITCPGIDLKSSLPVDKGGSQYLLEKHSNAIKLSDGNYLIVIGKGGAGSGWGGSFANGYGIIVTTLKGSRYVGNNMVLTALPYEHPNSPRGKRKFKDWTVNHEICFKNKETFTTINDTSLAGCNFLGKLKIVATEF